MLTMVPQKTFNSNRLARLIRFQHHDRRRCHSVAAAKRADSLGARGFHVDARLIRAECGGEPLAHRIEIRLELGLLGENRQVGVAQPPSAIAGELPGGREQRDRVGVLVARIAVGKVPAKVARTDRAEDRIGQRMSRDVRVRMAAQSLVVLDFDAAEHEPAARFERMKIESVAYAIPCRHCSNPRAEMTPASASFALRPTRVDNRDVSRQAFLIARQEDRPRCPHSLRTRNSSSARSWSCGWRTSFTQTFRSRWSRFTCCLSTY